MIYLWVALVALALTVGYGLIRLKQIEDSVDTAGEQIGGLAGDIVGLAWVIRTINEDRTADVGTTEEEVA